MQGARRIPIVELNQHLICILCKGYFVDATTIIECLHSFCRSCIVRYLETNKYCPVCDVQVHKTKPLLNIRPDKTLQDIVYKLVPRLFQNEMQRRREYYAAHPDAKPSGLEQCGEANYQHLLSPDETICLALSYQGSKDSTRYLCCPAAVSIGHIQKLIRAKYDLTENHRVDVFHNQDCLNTHLTLMDVAYIYLWKRKGPLELTYCIYENTAKRLKTEVNKTEETSTNNNDWKEVQLRISENGEMSVTGIQDIVDEVLNKPCAPAKRDLPGLKLLTTTTTVVSSGNATTPCVNSITDIYKSQLSIASTSAEKTVCTTASRVNSTSASSVDVSTTLTSALTIVAPSETHKTVPVSSASANCSSASENAAVSDLPVAVTNSTAAVSNSATAVSNSASSSKSECSRAKKESAEATEDVKCEKGVKHKLLDSREGEPPPKQVKQMVLNHSLGLQNLSNNHPLKKHSQLTRCAENADNKSHTEIKNKIPSSTSIPTIATTTNQIFSKPTNLINKTVTNLQLNRPGTPIASQKWSPKPTTQNSPCYMPKTTYSPIINVPKVHTSSSVRNDIKIISNTTITTSTPAINTKMTIKTKPSTPIGYKTLRDPPKSWNPQIPRASLNKTPTDPKYADLKNVRPAKFFKIRNNMPRYLGNPASGVKPMYQVHLSPEKEKTAETVTKSDKNEIKKHSIVKIDPKTLKPISEKAPETSSLSSQSSDLKINTSSVPIFSPLKLQSSPKNDRKSPKSPHSPKLKTSPPPAKRENKINRSFTPQNPFIPNLASPTVNPNQFLYPSGPPGFPTYDPRLVAAYHNFLYSQRMPFSPSPLQSLSLDLNQRKVFEMSSATSPKINPQLSPKSPVQMSPKLPGSPKTAQSMKTTTKKPGKDGQKLEKSLQNAVEKLTQNRAKESSKSDSAGPSVEANSVKSVREPEKISTELNERKMDLDTQNKDTNCIETQKDNKASSKTDVEKENNVAVNKNATQTKEDNAQSDIKDVKVKSDVNVDMGTKLKQENVSNNNTDSVASLVTVEQQK